jgi:3-oxo-5-alpha-steroid 4-dehydrogenase 1
MLDAPRAEMGSWTLPTTLVFVAANLSFGWYLLTVAPTLTIYHEGLCANISYGILALGFSQVVQFVTGWGAAPTGKFNVGALSFNAALPVNIAWWTMEQPSFLVPLVMLLNFKSTSTYPGALFLCMFMAHYLQRAFIYPWLSRGRPYPIHAWVSAMIFTTANGTLQANWLLYGAKFESDALYNPRAIVGYLIFVFGMGCNIHADHTLRNLRKPGETAYKIPHGGLFDYVSGAHFVGEVIEWTGFAIATASPAPMVFAAFNWMGIGTRAIATHEWNVAKFGDRYPKDRKKLIPLVW